MKNAISYAMFTALSMLLAAVHWPTTRVLARMFRPLATTKASHITVPLSRS